MKTKILAGIMLSTGMMIVSQSALAQGYVGGAFGTVNASDSGFSGSASAMRFFGGYQFTPNIAAEGGYVSSGAFGGDFSGADAKISGLEVSAVGTFPVSPQFSILGRVGMLNWTLDSIFGSTSGSDMFFGFGGLFNVNRNVAIRAEYDSYKADTTTANSMTIGVQYRF